jgi:NADPH:quinone reductase-like Zn-dependent oxidoreductase
LSKLVSQRLVPFLSKKDSAGLALLKELADAGKIRPVIDRQYALSEAAEAVRHLGEGRAWGKVLIKVQ